jgi:hypothetical protein
VFIYLSIIVGAYTFTRLFTAGIRNYPNDDKFTNIIIRVLSILVAILIAGCTIMIFIQGTENTLRDLLK